jgi:hypothetical protein
MAELEAETIERAVRWCAEAGRQTTPGEVRMALQGLGWDQLLALRALLADPPPARPLGPQALADLARGVPADVAAEREREQRYPRPVAEPAAPPPPTPAAVRDATPRAGTARRSRRGQPVVRKARTDAPRPAPEPPRRPLFEELLLPAGRGVLERLFRTHGGRRPRLVAAIAATYRRADGEPLGDADLDAALEHHGLARAFARRERDELLHAVRAAGGVLGQAAAALGHGPASLAASIGRLGLDADVRRLREARRRDLRSRATLSERALLLVGSADKLADLDLLGEFERDLAERLPEHLRALSTTGEPLELGLARTLSLPGAAVRELLARLGVELRAPPPSGPPPATAPSRGSPRSPPRIPGPGPRPGAPARRPPAARPPGARPAPARPSGTPSSVGHPPGARFSKGRPSGARPSAGRPPTGRTPAGRPPAGRPSPSRPPTTGRPLTRRPSGPRPPASRPPGRRRGPVR